MSVNKMNNGKWYCSFYYTDWQGIRKRKKKEGFNTQREAKAWESDFINRMTANCSMTFKNLVQLYLEDSATRLKPTTLVVKTSVINDKIAPYFNDIPISEITPVVIRKWQNEIINSGLAPSTQHNVNGILSAILNFAVKYYNLPFNPVARVGSIGKVKGEGIDFWTLEEYKHFISCEDRPEYKIIYELLFYTGLRFGEMFALTMNDIDTENGVLTVNKNKVCVNGEYITQTPKTRKSTRKITIPRFLVNDLIDYTQHLYGYEPEQNMFFFGPKQLSNELTRVSELSGIKRIRIHDLRHSHASLLIHMNFSPTLIADRLGHENVTTTLNTYGHLYPSRQSEVAEKLELLQQ
ncbi:site-specific integrase [Eubacterium sp. LMAG:50]|jgi:integrase|uniref:site-specific integrase n=1 Tax=Eubacterium sp. LMAG:50 TaxID=1969563 RepID=UPI0015BADA28|nr:site-specific integrase [Eubacterium sp. LMAG:50]